MKEKIINYVKAGYSGLYVVSSEECRVEQEIEAVAKATGFKLYAWSITEGIASIEKTPSVIANSNMPVPMLAEFVKLPEKSILMCRDFHMILSDRNPVVYRKMKDALTLGKQKNLVMVVVGCTLNLPAELEKEITVVNFDLPDRAQLETVMRSVCKSASVRVAQDSVDSYVDAMTGLTTIEAENAVALSIVEMKEPVASVIMREKCNVIKKNGLLEIVTTKTTLDDIGGLENLKLDLSEKQNLFTKEARDYGLSSPRGVMVVGQPGTGKSLTAQAVSSIFKIPLIRLEAGKLFGSLVGQSEGNWRTAFATAKACSPCIFWVDEVDGLFCGAKSSGETDSGVTNRVIKAILQDMQFNGEGIFFFFTANDIDGLPDTLIDRLDVWSVDLPNQTEREAIWKIHITKRKRDAKKFNLSDLAKRTEGFSGRQIEEVWKKAMTLAFNAHREPTGKDILEAAARFVPTSVTMKEAIQARRERLKDRAMAASAPEAKTSGARKLAVN